MQGKEGGFIDKMVRDTAGIRSGLDAVGNFIGTSAGVISESSLSETIHRTGEYWKDTYATTRASLRKKSAEDIVYQVGNVSGMIAVGAVTGYAAKGVQASSILGQEIALSSKLAPIGK